MRKTKRNARMNGKTDLTFKELRGYLSTITRLSICMRETLNYKNYIRLADVPHSYDDFYVYGIDAVESEFYKTGEYEYAADGEPENLVFAGCMEVMLSEKPRSSLRNPK